MSARFGVRRISAAALATMLALVGVAAAPLAPIPGARVEAQNAHLIVISGLGGDPNYRSLFVEWGTTMVNAAHEAGVPRENIVFLAEDPQAAPQVITGRSTRIEVERVFGEVARRAEEEDRIFVLLIGHGSGSGAGSRVSLSGGSAGGGSLTATDYANLLGSLAPRRVAFVNLASASGDFVTQLSAPGRVIVTATRSSQQRNAPIFGGYFVQAYTGEGSDLDRDGRVSIVEAFEFARQETARYYSDAGLIAPEHALIEDRAGGSGVLLPAEAPEVGAVASRFFLDSAVPTSTTADPAAAARLRELYTEQERLENEVADLTRLSGTMEAAAYQAALQTLLVELARVGQEIRRLEGAP